MAIKITVDLSDATFAEMAAVIGYAHKLGVDPDEKLNFEGTVLTFEFDADLEHDDLFLNLEEEDADLGTSDEEGPLYVEDFLSDEDLDGIDAEEGYHTRRSPREDPSAAEVINDLGEVVNKFVNGFIGGGNNRNRPGYGDFGNGNLFGPFGPFGPRGPRGRY